MHLALQALRKYKNSEEEVEDKEEEEEEPPSLLLLLATTNADKPSSPASYEHRLAMMCLLAEEIQNKISSSSSSSPSSSSIDNILAPQIDIGITPHPRFIDKSTDLSNHPFFPSEVTRQTPKPQILPTPPHPHGPAHDPPILHKQNPSLHPSRHRPWQRIITIRVFKFTRSFYFEKDRYGGSG
ncbi:hypothetical protein TWF706_001242 [Orbilia oligospora]|nr:hypothetical protein TWF706_001242 [Orbilia oligospora]